MCNDSVKYLNKGQLVALNNKAIAANMENFMSRGSIRILPKDAKFPIIDAITVDGHLAIEVALNPQGNTGFLDVTPEEYEALPDFTINQDVYGVLDQLLEEGAPQYH